MLSTRRLGRIEWVCVIGLLLLAATLHLIHLQDYPAGYHNDEVALAHAVETALSGPLRIFFPKDTGHEAFYMYWSAPFRWALGPTVFALRLPSFFLLMLALCAVWALTRRLFGPLAAGASLAALSVSWWGMLLGRSTLHVIAVAPTLALAVYWGVRLLGVSHSVWDGFLSGVFFALAFNSYTAARIAPLLVLVWLVYLALVRRALIEKYWRGLSVLVSVAALLSAPLALYLLTHPGAKQLQYATFNADQPVTDLLAGDPKLAIQTSLQTFGMFAFAGDPLTAFNIPGRPLFEPVGAALLLLGVVISLQRWRDPRYGALSIGLGITLLPGVLSQPAPNYPHTVGAMVFVFPLFGAGVEAAWQWAIARRPSAAQGHALRRRLGALALAALLIGNVIWTARDFFIIWPALPETRWWMQTGLKELADRLNREAQTGPVAVCVPFRLIDEKAEWWRPAWMLFHHLSPRHESEMRWYDCAESLVIPQGVARFAFPEARSLDQLDGLAVSRWMQNVSNVERVGGGVLARADLMPAWTAEVGQLIQAAPVVQNPDDRSRSIALPADFGHALQLAAYQVEGQAAPGSVITATTYWRVTAPPEPRLVLFTHILAGTSTIVAQADYLALTSARLQPGDMFLQIHAIRLPEDLPPGEYEVAVGLYMQDTGKRLPVYVGEARLGDHVRLKSVLASQP